MMQDGKISAVQRQRLAVAVDAQERHVAMDLRGEDRDRVRDPVLARDRRGVIEGTPDPHELRAERKGLEHIARAADAAIHHHGHVPGNGADRALPA